MPLGWGGNPAPFLLNNSVKYGTLLMVFVGGYYPSLDGASHTLLVKAMKARKPNPNEKEL